MNDWSRVQSEILMPSVCNWGDALIDVYPHVPVEVLMDRTRNLNVSIDGAEPEFNDQNLGEVLVDGLPSAIIIMRMREYTDKESIRVFSKQFGIPIYQYADKEFVDVTATL